MTPVKPSLDLLRSLTDEHVLRALTQVRQLTRAELATHTGLSKPTVSDSVRRLTAAGLLRDTGDRTTGRGRVGSYYALADDLGHALVVSIAPDGIVAETLDVHGAVLTHDVTKIPRSVRPGQVSRALSATIRRASADVAAPLPLAVVSAADPVDRSSGRLVHLPDAPFLLGELSPADVLAPFVSGPVTVDNDVHWAARAERHRAQIDAVGDLDDFAYLYLGEGLGCAIVSDGQVRRGHGGIAGEIAHLTTRGPRGRAVRLTDVFDELGLRRPGSTAIDTDRLLASTRGNTSGARRLRGAIADAVDGVLCALVALTDPECILVGGTWGRDAAILASISDGFAQVPRHVWITAARVTDEPALAGARQYALEALRSVVLHWPDSGEPVS